MESLFAVNCSYFVLLPNAFKSNNHLEEIKGIYVPFWLFDGAAEGSVQYEATKVRKYRSGDYEITDTSYYDVQRAGRVNFEKIPVDGSKKMPDDYVRHLSCSF